MFDPDTLERRPITKEEVGNFALISDALPNIHIVGIEAMPQDVAPKASILHGLDTVLKNTTKHIYFSPENVDETIPMINMLKAVEEDLVNYPIATCQLSPISPLMWSEGTALAVVEIAKSGIPLSVLPEPLSGVTSPITLAGLLTVNNIEVLSAVVLSQIVREGAPLMYGASWTTFDMAKATVLIGSPESCLLGIAEAQLARHYDIPSHTTALNTDSNLHDEQCSFEKIFNLITSLQAGINLVVNAGMFATGMTVSYEQLIADHEMATFVYRYLKGMEVNKDTIAGDIIAKVGPGKNYMMEEYTLKYMRTGEHCSYDISNRDVYDTWKEAGKPDLMDNARAHADKILDEHKPEPLPDDSVKKIEYIISKYEKEHS